MRDALRKKALGAFPSKKETVEVDGVKYEVRQPSCKSRSAILKASKAQTGDTEKLDVGLLQVRAMIECTFDPETGDRVFEEADCDVLLSQPAGALDALSECALKLMNVDTAEVRGNSARTPADSSSSP